MKNIVTFLLIAQLFLFTQNADAQNKKYSNNSGIISYVLIINNIKASQNLIFQDYGKNSCVEVEVEVLKQKGHTRSFNTENYRYTVDMINQTFHKQERLDDIVSTSPTDFDYYLENGMAEKKSPEMFMGKNCDVYVMTTEQIDAKFWVWDNLILKMNTVTADANVRYEAIDFEFSDSKSRYNEYFDVPEGFTEVKKEK